MDFNRYNQLIKSIIKDLIYIFTVSNCWFIHILESIGGQIKGHRKSGKLSQFALIKKISRHCFYLISMKNIQFKPQV
jgi:hypothetical protein